MTINAVLSSKSKKTCYAEGIISFLDHKLGLITNLRYSFRVGGHFFVDKRQPKREENKKENGINTMHMELALK